MISLEHDSEWLAAIQFRVVPLSTSMLSLFAEYESIKH